MQTLAKPSARLTSKIDNLYIGDQGQTDDEGRLLVWEATLEGNITGTMKWWFESPPPAPEIEYEGGKIAYYSARWEIWDGGKLILAGESAGKTIIPDKADGIWDGHGVVLEASKEFIALKGRHVYETGPVIWEPSPWSGTGLFVLY